MKIIDIYKDMKIRKKLYQDKLTPFNILINDLIQGDEIQMLNILQQKLKEVSNKINNYSQQSNKRGVKRAQSLKKLTHNSIKETFKYLDVGCNDGSLTNSISEYFKFDKNNVYGTDIKEWNGIENDCHVKNMFYINEENPLLPYPDNHFDLITCFQTLHHNKNVDVMVHELKRVLKKGGILILREHDLNSNISKEFIDFEHLIYMCIEMEKVEVDNYIGNYKSKNDWRRLFRYKIINSIKSSGLTNIYTDVMIK